MKNKSIVARRKRHELRSMVLELAAKVEWKEVELLTENVENNQLKKEIGELKSKFGLQGELLSETKDKLIEQKNITCRATRANEEMVRDYYDQFKQLEKANKVISQRNNTINNQNNTISELQVKVIELSSENEQLKKPFWKKVKGCLVK